MLKYIKKIFILKSKNNQNHNNQHNQNMMINNNKYNKKKNSKVMNQYRMNIIIIKVKSFKINNNVNRKIVKKQFMMNKKKMKIMIQIKISKLEI